MQITLYKNASENIVVNKLLNEISILNGTLREGTSILEPSILIEISNEENYALIDDVIDNDGDELVFNDVANILKCNYAYIKEFNRYYYINDIIVTNNKLYRINMSVDVLMSFKNTYLELDALISRNEFNYDNSIEDDKMPYEFYQQVDEYKMSDKFPFNPAVDIASICYYISVLQKDASYDTDVIVSPIDCLPNVRFTSGGKNKFQSEFGMIWSDVNALADWIVQWENDAGKIMSLVALPFELQADGYIYDLYLGGSNTGINCYGLKNQLSEYFEVASFYVNTYAGFNRGYREFEPYSIYELYLPYYGYITLKSSDIHDSLIKVYYSFDFQNASAKINVVNYTKNYVIKSVNANIGVKISVNRTNNQQLFDEKVQLGIKSGIGALTSVASIVGGAVTKNPYLIAGGVTGLGSTATEIASSLVQMHETGSTANNSGIDGLYGSQQVRLKVTKYVTKEPSNYAHYYGRPLNRTLKLNTLHGYTIIKDIHLENLDATRNEITELLSLLTTGIIL